MNKAPPPLWPAEITNLYYTNAPPCMADPCRELAAEVHPKPPEDASRNLLVFLFDKGVFKH